MAITFTGIEFDPAFAEEVAAHDLFRIVSNELALRADKPSFDLIIWFYRAPWSIPVRCEMRKQERSITSSEEMFKSWLTLHKALLRKRRGFAGQLMIVNADEVDPYKLFCSIGIADELAKKLTALQSWEGNKIFDQLIVSDSVDSPFSDWLDVLETLDAFAVGEKKESREDDFETAARKIFYCIDGFLNGAEVPSLKIELAATANELKQLVAEKSSMTHSHAEVLSCHHDVLANAQKKLEAETSCRARLQTELGASKSELEKLKISQKKLQDEVSHSAQLKAATEKLVKDLEIDKSKISAELSSHISENKKMSAKLQELSLQCQKSSDELKAAAAKYSEANTLNSLRHVELQDERDLLLSQMQMLQDELDRYYEKNTALDFILSRAEVAMIHARERFQKMVEPDTLEHLLS